MSNSYSDIQASILAEFPKFKIVPKESSGFMRLLDTLLRIITLNQMNTFMTGFITTIGFTVYVNSGWLTTMADSDRTIVLRHERVHMRQRVTYGQVLFSLLYLLVLPVGLAYFRMKFEREAYTETFLAVRDFTDDEFVRTAEFRANFLGDMAGASYVWMWPFKGSNNKWFDSLLNIPHTTASV